MGRQEAFEIFKTEHEDNITLEDNKVILKQRSVSFYSSPIFVHMKLKGMMSVFFPFCSVGQ